MMACLNIEKISNIDNPPDKPGDCLLHICLFLLENGIDLFLGHI